MSKEEKVVWDAEFNDAVTSYWLVNGALICVATIIGIPLLIFWFLIGKWATRKYLASHNCTLTDRSLKVSKGVLTQIEKTVPLDRITDVSVVQGPIMRYFDIEALSVETAGQSTVGAMVRLAGIKNGRDFRDAVLKQRDLVVGSMEGLAGGLPLPPAGMESGADGGEVVQLLKEINETLKRIESK